MTKFSLASGVSFSVLAMFTSYAGATQLPPEYPGTFYNGNSLGYNGMPIGDWANGDDKGQCGPSSKAPVVGVSQNSFSPHDILCGYADASNFTQTAGCYSLHFNPNANSSYPGNGPNPFPYTDWDYGYYKAECASNEFVAGVSQSTPSNGALVDGILCCPGSGGTGTSNTLAAQNCDVEIFTNQNSTDYAPTDWDNGYYKGQCRNGKYVVGVSTYPSGYLLPMHALLCCESANGY